jgi:hypothetical protein
MLTVSSLRSSTASAQLKQGDPRPVSILSSNPLLQNKTLTIKAEARGMKVYPMVLVFYNVDYSLERDAAHPLSVRPRLGEPFFMAPVSEGTNPVQVRCQCPFFRFAWAHWNHESKALSGAPLPTYIRKTTTRPEVNASHTPGVCKHIIGFFTRLHSDRILV